MSTWSLSTLLGTLHEDIHQRLSASRKAFAHSTTKGNASEAVWLEMLQTYLPERYAANTAHVVDSEGSFSEQMDVVIFDRQYSPFILKYQGQSIVPAESVYAVFECKQAISANRSNMPRRRSLASGNLHERACQSPMLAGSTLQNNRSRS